MTRPPVACRAAQYSTLQCHISEGELYDDAAVNTNFIPSDAKLTAALPRKKSDVNSAITSRLFQRKRSHFADLAAYPTPRVYAKATRELQDVTPCLAGPLLKLVHLLQRLKTLEGVIKLMSQRSRMARSKDLRCEGATRVKADQGFTKSQTISRLRLLP